MFVLLTMVGKVNQTVRMKCEFGLFSQSPPSQRGTCSSQIWSNYTRQLIISQLPSIMARDPGLVLKNQKPKSSQFNDPGISIGFTSSGFLARPLNKSLLPAAGGGIEFVKLANNAGK